MSLPSLLPPGLQTVECGDLRSTPNGRVFLTGTAVGSTATYLCDDGFRLEGDRNRACQETGEWSGKEPTCIRKRNYDPLEAMKR